MYKNLNSVLFIVDLTSLTYLYNIPKAETDIASALDKDIEEGVGGLLVLKNVKNNKYSESDGLTTEFYKFFWNDPKVFIMRQ